MSKRQREKYDSFRSMGYEYEETTKSGSFVLIKKEYVGDSSSVIDEVVIDKDGLVTKLNNR